MNSCSHFSNCLSDHQVIKKSAMSKRGQKTTSNEGSPMAKARPCLVARDPRSEEISSRSLGFLVNLGIPMKEKKSKQQLEAVGDSLQDQKSDTLKRIDKRML